MPRSADTPPVTLYLIRHAVAAERGPEWPDDTERPLTARGVERFDAAMRGLRRVADIDELFHSPLVRARQTAERVAAGLRQPPPLRVLPTLAPGQPPRALLRELARTARSRRIALVGHEPDLGLLAAHLLGVEQPLPFRKGGACRIDIPSLAASARGALVWFLPPRVLRTIGRGGR